MDQPQEEGHYHNHNYPPSGASSDTFKLEPFLYKDTSTLIDDSHGQSQADQKKQQRIASSRAIVALHAALVVQYSFLIVIWVPHLEHTQSIKISKRSDMLRTLVTQMQTLFAAVYSALLVFMTQRQALRAHLSARQTLTSLHDCLAAWIGLGSSLLAVGHQAKLPSGARNAVVAIAAYLLSIFSYHTVAPTLFELSIYNSTTPFAITMRYHHPDSTLYDLPFDFLRAMAMFPAMSTPGLANETTIYDVPTSSLFSGFGMIYMKVNQTTFDARCSGIPGKQTGWSHATSGALLWNITLEDGRTFTVPKPPHMTLRVLPVPLDENYLNPTTPNITIMATFPIPMQPGHGIGIDITPSMVFNESNSSTKTSVISFLTCSMSYTSGVATIDGSNWYIQDTLVTVDVPLQPTTSYPWEQTWSRLVSWGFPQNSTLNPASTAFNRSMDLLSPLPKLSNTEIVLLRQVGVSSWSDDPSDPASALSSAGSITMERLEGSIAQMTAKMYWAAANVAKSDHEYFSAAGWSGGDLDDDVRGVIVRTCLRLNINAVALFIGFASSVAATALSYLLARPPNRKSQISIPRAVDSAGLLQWTYLLTNVRQTERVADVEEATVSKLRSAGMKVIWDGLRRRA